MENDPSINLQAQETTVTASTTKEAQVLSPASGLSKDHQEVETIGSGSAETSDQSESPDEASCGNHPKDKTEPETNQSFQGGNLGRQPSSESLSKESLQPESLGEESLHLEPSCCPSEEGGRADAQSGSSSVDLPEEASHRPEASQEPLAVDPQGVRGPGHSGAGPESQGTRRRRLVEPGERAHWLLSCSVSLVTENTAAQGPFQRTSLSWDLVQGHIQSYNRVEIRNEVSYLLDLLIPLLVH